MLKEIFKLKAKDGTTIEVVRFGSGKPSILLISGIHGNEKTGPKILERLINQMDFQKKILGTLDIIRIANPKAYQANQRLHPEDHKDLNRSFLRTAVDLPTYLLSNILAEFARSHTLVIDMHAFPGQISPLIGVFLSDGNKEKRKESHELLRIIQPDLIWSLDTHKVEPQKGGSICSFALKNNIAAFGLELPPIELFSKVQFGRVLEGLKAVCAKLGVMSYPYPTKKANEIPIYERLLYKSPYEGQFIPQKDILAEIRRNEIVGHLIIGRRASQIRKVYSPENGVLMTISKKRAVKEGEKLFVLGKKFVDPLP